MNTHVPNGLPKPAEDARIGKLPIIRQGIYRDGEELVEYVLLQPSPDQWVIMSMVSAGPGRPRALVVAHGTSETEAFRRLARRLHPSGPPAAYDSFATEWAMRAPER